MRSCRTCRPSWPPGPAPASSAVLGSTPMPEHRPNEVLLESPIYEGMLHVRAVVQQEVGDTHAAFKCANEYRDRLTELERLTRERVVDDPQEARRWWQCARLPWRGERNTLSAGAGG